MQKPCGYCLRPQRPSSSTETGWLTILKINSTLESFSSPLEKRCHRSPKSVIELFIRRFIVDHYYVDENNTYISMYKRIIWA